MFEEIPIIIGFLLFSILVSYLLLKYVPEPFKKIFVGFMIVGIIIHELFHLLMCLITNTPVEKVNLLEKIKSGEGSGNKKYEFYGSVSINREKETSFLQVVLVAVAPLFFSFWIFFLLLHQVIHPANEIIFFVCLFIVLSIMFSAAPSSTDLACIPRAFGDNPKYSTYQILLLLLSILLVWMIIPFLKLPILHETIIYLFIMLFYYLVKYGFKMVSLIFRFAIPSKNFKNFKKEV